jgi:hypothetical protein
VVFDHEGTVEELADLPAGGRRVYLVELIERLCRGHVMGHGQTPQIGEVICGMSSARRPWTNFSKPRSSGIWR